MIGTNLYDAHILLSKTSVTRRYQSAIGAVVVNKAQPG